jgi:hypothetical protein
MTPTPLVASGETVGRLAGRGARPNADAPRERRRTRAGPTAREKTDAQRTGCESLSGEKRDNKTAALRSILREPRRTCAARNAKPITEETTMSDRTNYGTIAEKIDYTKLDKKLEQLRGQEPPKKRKSAGDVLEPMREKLTELHAPGIRCASR